MYNFLRNDKTASILRYLPGENPAHVIYFHYLPLIDPEVDAFVPNRVMFGSNRSLSEMRSTYEEMIQILKSYCLQKEHLSTEQLHLHNTQRAYHLKSKEQFDKWKDIIFQKITKSQFNTSYGMMVPK